MNYEELENIYNRYFSMSTLGTDFTERLGLIGLICYLYNKLKLKKPDLTYWELVYKLGKNIVEEDSLKGLSIMCEHFAQNCTDFPNYGLEDKDIPKKIQDILSKWLPF